jgi:hypothetical protein
MLYARRISKSCSSRVLRSYLIGLESLLRRRSEDRRQMAGHVHLADLLGGHIVQSNRSQTNFVITQFGPCVSYTRSIGLHAVSKIPVESKCWVRIVGLC